MLKSFRLQIALWFIGLSLVVYLLCSVAGAAYFYSSLSHSMDGELRTVASQIGHAIDLTGTRPAFRDWLRVVQTEPDRSVMSMQLYDPKGKLLDHYGPVGIPKLFSDLPEVKEGDLTVRVRRSPLLHHGTLVGYLQLQLPTSRRAELTKEFVITMLVMSPFIGLGLCLCSYIVSGLAVRPIEQLVATLQQFVADAGHELNTPASIIQARAQSLERKLGKQGMSPQDLRIISSSAERMGSIVKNLMLLAELDSNHVPPKRAVNIAEVLDTVIRESEARFDEKGIQLRMGINRNALVIADAESLHCIFSNLLENAHKYTERNGTVTAACEVDGSDAKVTIEDTGVGIPAESLPHIFDRFYRVEKSRSRKSGGSGLGLSIVKAIVQSLHGRVEVASIPGKGSTFRVFLPIYRGTSLHKNCTQEMNT